MDWFHNLMALRRAEWQIPLAVAAFLLIDGSVQVIHRHVMISRLLKTATEEIHRDQDLSKFAQEQALPLYGRFCLGCHGPDLNGDPAKGIPNLRDEDWLYGSGRVSEIERIVLYGIRSGNGKGWNQADMPAYASASPYGRFAVDSLTPGDIHDTVEYLRTLEQKSADQDAARRGQQIFAGRGACYDCHAPDGHGDSAIGAPNLTDDVWLYGDGSRQSVFESIARGHHGSCPAWTRKLAAWQVRALAVYVRDAALSAQKSRDDP
jgi:cytochrome c oxidase cbb3-type subunit III